MAKTKRIKSGIPGMDELIGGGIPSRSVVLVSGSAGTGKTILCLQFIASGCMKHNERGLYVTFEQRAGKLREQAEAFGWNFGKLEKEGKLKILTISQPSLGTMLLELERAIAKFKPQRLVIDSVTHLAVFAHGRKRVVDIEKIPVDELLYNTRGSEPSGTQESSGVAVRKMLVDLVSILESKDICTLLTSEVSKNSEWYSRDTLSEFACDGILLLKSISLGDECQRTIECVKMRNTEIKGGIYPFDFKKSGIFVTTR